MWISSLCLEVIHLSPILNIAFDPGYGIFRTGAAGAIPPRSAASVVLDASSSQAMLMSASFEYFPDLDFRPPRPGARLGLCVVVAPGMKGTSSSPLSEVSDDSWELLELDAVPSSVGRVFFPFRLRRLSS